MNANEMTFGCEIECYVPVGTIQRIGTYRVGIQVPELPAGWVASSDGSLHGTPRGYTAVEIKSPILKGIEGMRQVVFVCKWLNQHNARVDHYCGYHVHVGVDNRTDLLQKICCITSKHQKALYAATGSNRRENSVSYARTIQNDERLCNAILTGDINLHGPAGYERRRVVNLVPILSGEKPTVEFRVFAGTTNAVKTVSYIRMCLAIVEKAHAMKQLPKWTAKQPKESSPMRRKGGEGSSEVNRFFYYMGWTRGQQKEIYGNIQGEGIATLEESKKELMRLAAKYDAR